jgi:hypothetical protein
MARPRRPPPPPLETNDVRVAATGTAVWAVGLVVLLVIGLPEADRWWLWVCVGGIAIGLFGVWYIPRLQRSRAALIASHAAEGTHAEATDAAPGGADAGHNVHTAHNGDTAHTGDTVQTGHAVHSGNSGAEARPGGGEPAGENSRHLDPAPEGNAVTDPETRRD